VLTRLWGASLAAPLFTSQNVEAKKGSFRVHRPYHLSYLPHDLRPAKTDLSPVRGAGYETCEAIV
jgi:hypothetical protein